MSQRTTEEPGRRAGREISKSLQKHTRPQHSTNINNRKAGHEINIESTNNNGQNNMNSETSLPNSPPKKEKRVILRSLVSEGKEGGFDFALILSKIEAWSN